MIKLGKTLATVALLFGACLTKDGEMVKKLTLEDVSIQEVEGKEFYMAVECEDLYDGFALNLNDDSGRAAPLLNNGVDCWWESEHLDCKLKGGVLQVKGQKEASDDD